MVTLKQLDKRIKKQKKDIKELQMTMKRARVMRNKNIVRLRKGLSKLKIKTRKRR